MSTLKFFATAASLLLLYSSLLAQDLTVGSYNVRNDNAADAAAGNGWKERRSHLCAVVRLLDYDIFGAQEVLVNQRDDMLSLLPGYACVGVGRDDGKEKGEFEPVFYKTSRFTLLDSGTFWLSETPWKPSRGWDAACIRCCTWAYLQDKKEGQKLFFFNLHLDHVGKVARRKGAQLAVDVIRQKCDSTANVILTGDFNLDQRSEPYAVVTSSGLLDTWKAAEDVIYAGGTFNNFEIDSWTDQLIDHIFISSSFECKSFSVVPTHYWQGIDEALSEEDQRNLNASVNEVEFKSPGNPSNGSPCPPHNASANEAGLEVACTPNNNKRTATPEKSKSAKSHKSANTPKAATADKTKSAKSHKSANAPREVDIYAFKAFLPSDHYPLVARLCYR